jgi:hypothetical protein
MSKKFLVPVVPVLAAAALAATPALADAPAAISANWAGYEAAPGDGSNGFSDVSGSWVQPRANCSNTTGTYAAFWVGLGGSSDQSQSLEQIGTQADCDNSGSATYYAWYELVPAAPVVLSMQINAGDQIKAAVHVNGSAVTVSLLDQTTGDSVNRTLQMSAPDTSSAEWIAEAPSSCQDGAGGSCTPLPLTDFGAVSFSNATATADGYTGTINDSSWSAQPLALDSSQDGLSSSGYGYGADSAATSGSTAGAQPSSLSSDGSSFSVSYSAGGVDPTASSGGGSGYGSGGSGYGSSGSGYGSSGSGYGSSGSGYGSSGSGYGSGGSGYGYGGSGYGYGGSGYGYGYGYGGGPYDGSGGYGYGDSNSYGGGGGLPGISFLLGF